MCLTWIRLCIPLSYPHTGIDFPYKFSIDFVEIGIHYKKTNAGFYRIFVQITFVQLTFEGLRTIVWGWVGVAHSISG